MEHCGRESLIENMDIRSGFSISILLPRADILLRQKVLKVATVPKGSVNMTFIRPGNGN